MKKVVSVLLLVILFAGAAFYSITKTPDPVDELPPPPVPPVLSAEKQQPEPQPQETPVDPALEIIIEPEAIPQPLPPLIESDAEVTSSLAGIAGADSVAEYLVMDQIISRVVASIDSLTSRQVPVHINPIRPAGDKFLVDTEGERMVMSPRNFARYDGYIALLQNTDSGSLIQLYRRYYPLFQQAWEENGGAGSFNDRLMVVFDNLMETPDIPGPVYLTKPEAVYQFENPQLESMIAGQKILIRMGSANATVVKEKLAELRSQLNQQVE